MLILLTIPRLLPYLVRRFLEIFELGTRRESLNHSSPSHITKRYFYSPERRWIMPLPFHGRRNGLFRTDMPRYVDDRAQLLNNTIGLYCSRLYPNVRHAFDVCSFLPVLLYGNFAVHPKHSVPRDLSSVISGL